MPIIFNENYFNNGIEGYLNYRDYSHFAQRAAWINNLMITEGYTHVTILGAGYGFLIKHLVETHGFTNSTVQGIENSTYALAQAELLGYGVSQGYMINSDIRTHIYDPTDLVVSWNVLDCMADLSEVQAVIGQINNIQSVAQAHVYVASEDPMQSRFNSQGYFLPSFLDVFLAMEMSAQDDESFLTRYHDGFTYRIIRQGGSKFGAPHTGLMIPTCWGAVSD